MVRSTVLNCTFVGHTVVLHIHSHRVQVMPRKPLVYDGLVSERRKLTKDQACKKVELMKTGTCKYRDLHYGLMFSVYTSMRIIIDTSPGRARVINSSVRASF
jgi:hypothetical protein